MRRLHGGARIRESGIPGQHTVKKNKAHSAAHVDERNSQTTPEKKGKGQCKRDRPERKSHPLKRALGTMGRKPFANRQFPFHLQEIPRSQAGTIG
jgi:hypothetical protein